MNTPIYNFISEYAKSDISRMHMPGHKGIGKLGIEALDLTEIKGADSLFSADGIIYESECEASRLFDTAHSFYSTEGSTLAIKTMLALAVCSSKSKGRRTVLASRNVHKSFVCAAALLDFTPKWIYGISTHPCECIITPDDVERELSSMEESPAAVYITSPDYLGQVADVAGISAVCKKYDVPLLVDNAHGAYLGFLSPSLHPIALGADMCADSAHKTLPVLTGGAYLHISKKSAGRFLSLARSRMSVFASTSPSYLILASLDLCNSYISDGYSEKLLAAVSKIEEARVRLSDIGFSPEPTEPLKIVLRADKFGYTGDELADLLREYSVEPEFSDRDYLVLMLTPENCEEGCARVFAAFSSIKPREAIAPTSLSVISGHERAISVREAVFSDFEILPIEKALGRVAAAPTVSCPPAVPIVISGEIIGKDDVELFSYYGISEISVIK